MGALFIWVVLLGLPLLVACGFLYARYLGKTGNTSSHEDGA